MTPEQEARLIHVEQLLAALVRPDRITVKKVLQFDEARDLKLGTVIGTKIGTSALEKIGFFGGTPQAQTVLPNPSITTVTTTVNALYTALINNGLFSV